MRYLLLLFMFISFFCRGQQEHYLFSFFTDNGQDGLHLASSVNGLEWKVLKCGKPFLTPTIGGDKLMRDPFVMQGPDGIYRMVWTCSWKERQIGYACSKDLINWSEQKAIPVMSQEPTARNCWAPEIVYDPSRNNYLIIWATTIPCRHSEVSGSEKEIGMNHRIYSTTTTDFVKFTPARLFFNPDFSVIDATILLKGGSYYMFLKNENPNPPEKNIRFTTSKTASGPYPTSVSGPITGNYWAEGPSALEIGEYVYVYFDKYKEHKYGAVRSRDMQHWEDLTDQISFPEGVRHGTAFRISRELYEKLTKLK